MSLPLGCAHQLPRTSPAISPTSERSPGDGVSVHVLCRTPADHPHRLGRVEAHLSKLQFDFESGILLIVPKQSYSGHVDVTTQDDGQARVLITDALKTVRGGCWGMFPSDCRSAARRGHAPDAPSDTIGFRVVLVVG